MKRHRIREYREGRGTSQKREIVQQRVAANLEAVLEMEVEEGSDEEEGGGGPYWNWKPQVSLLRR